MTLKNSSLDRGMATRSSFVKRYQIALYFGLAYAFTWLGWGSEIAQQHGLLGFHIPRNLAYSGLPLAALLVAGLTAGRAGIKDVLARVIRWRVPARGYLLAVLVPIGLPLLTCGLYLLLGGRPQVGMMLPLAAVPWYLLNSGIFFTLTEELGWRGFALPRLQARYSALVASLILGVLWAFWHTPLFLLQGSGQTSYPFAGFVLFTIAESVLLAWVANHSMGSVLLAGLFHTLSDGSLLFFGALTGDQGYFWLSVLVKWLVVIAVVRVEGPAHLAKQEDAPNAQRESVATVSVAAAGGAVAQGSK